MHRSTEPPPGEPLTDADRIFAARVLGELLDRIEVDNANAAAYPRPGRYTFLMSHAWTDGAAIRLVYTAPPSDRTWGLARDTRESLINPASGGRVGRRQHGEQTQRSHDTPQNSCICVCWR